MTIGPPEKQNLEDSLRHLMARLADSAIPDVAPIPPRAKARRPRFAVAAISVVAILVAGAMVLVLSHHSTKVVTLGANSSTTLSQTAANSVPTTIAAPVTSAPQALVTDRTLPIAGSALAIDGDRLYVLQRTSGGSDVAIVDIQSGRVLRMSAVPPNAVAVSVGFGSLWLLETGPTRPSDPPAGLDRLSMDNLNVQAHIATDTTGQLISFSSNGVWLGEAASIVEVDPLTNMLMRSVPLSGLVSGLAATGNEVVASGINAAGTRSILWEVDANSGTVTGQRDIDAAASLSNVAAITPSSYFVSLIDVRGSTILERHFWVAGSNVLPVLASGNIAIPASADSVWLAETATQAAVASVELVTAPGVFAEVSVPGPVRGLIADSTHVYVVSDSALAVLARPSR